MTIATRAAQIKVQTKQKQATHDKYMIQNVAKSAETRDEKQDGCV